MAGKYLAYHRPICNVIDEISSLASRHDDFGHDAEIIKLCAEAKDYAQRMSKKLQWYHAQRMEQLHGTQTEVHPAEDTTE